MNEDQRKEYIDNVGWYIIKDLRLKDPKQYSFSDKLGDITAGRYNRENRSVEINPILMNDYARLIRTIAHEYRHDWQMTIVPTNDYEKLVQDSALHPIEFNGHNLLEYKNQLCELDADNYAKKFIERFLEYQKGGV